MLTVAAKREEGKTYTPLHSLDAARKQEPKGRVAIEHSEKGGEHAVDVPSTNRPFDVLTSLTDWRLLGQAKGTT